MGIQKPLLLAVDDEVDMLETYRSILSKKYQLLTAASGHAALELLQNNSVALILMDIRMPKMDGLTLLKKINALEPGAAVIMVTASKDIASAVEAMRLGAFDYVTKPFDVKELLVNIEKALEQAALVKENLGLKAALKEATAGDLIGNSLAMKKLQTTIARVAPTDSTVLIHGESGTGKEVVARAIHKQSRRAEKPFIAINCAAIPENLLESELFGHERGSFTGASDRKLGKFELADSGTLFLDEIGCMPAPMQAKLLRVLEDRTIERVGGEKGVPIDVRIISATNIDFDKAIAEGKFRHDLYYRLNVIPINLVPLRDRKEDIPLFIANFLAKFNRELNKNIKGFSSGALRALVAYDWPGNVRELQNMIERLIVLATGSTIEAEDLPFSSEKKPGTLTIQPAAGKLHDALFEYEKVIVKKALEENSNNHSQAAKTLGIARSSLNSRLKSLGLS